MAELGNTVIKGNLRVLGDIISQSGSGSGGDINEILNAVYPVGSIYMSINSTNPSTLFGGTWTQIKDTFLLSAGDTYNNGATGGEATHTLTSAEMPKHKHTFTGEAHSHGLNSHTHTYDKSKSPTGQSSGNTGASSGNTGSTTLTVNQIPSHHHGQRVTANPGTGGSGIRGDYNEDGSGFSGYAQGMSTEDTGGGQGHTHSLNSHTHSLNSHTHTVSTESKNTGAASGNTASATQGGTIGNTGSGGAHNNMPPYLVVYV